MSSAILCTANNKGRPRNHINLQRIPINSPTPLFSRPPYSPSLCQFTRSPTGSESPMSLSRDPIGANSFSQESCATPNKTYSGDWNRFPQSKASETSCDGGFEDNFGGSWKSNNNIVSVDTSPLIGRDTEKAMSNSRSNDSALLKGDSRDSPRQRSYQMFQISKRQFLRTKLCPFLSKGKCTNGRNCSYAHATEQLRPLPDLRKTKLCDETKKGRQCTNPHCTFAHAVHQLKPPTPDLITYKTTMCFFWKKGKCFNGEKCRFAHGGHELRSCDLSKPPDRSGVDEAPPGYATDSSNALVQFLSSPTLSSLGVEFFRTLLPRSSDKGDIAQEDVVHSLRQLLDQNFSVSNNINNDNDELGVPEQHDLISNEVSPLEYHQGAYCTLAAGTPAETPMVDLSIPSGCYPNGIVAQQMSPPQMTNDSFPMETSAYPLNGSMPLDFCNQDCGRESSSLNCMSVQPTTAIMAALETLLLSYQNC